MQEWDLYSKSGYSSYWRARYYHGDKYAFTGACLKDTLRDSNEGDRERERESKRDRGREIEGYKSRGKESHIEIYRDRAVKEYRG